MEASFFLDVFGNFSSRKKGLGASAPMCRGKAERCHLTKECFDRLSMTNYNSKNEIATADEEIGFAMTGNGSGGILKPTAPKLPYLALPQERWAERTAGHA
ncbi:hypothetical protein FA048_06465 [Pedobacter polaris]|uniref:Uncharacterized protein n=1 Tax=Pedobacter polaris TaxID=2571273 RepID=A0A4U1CQD9_9SPHI|nr:hypothetical protein [Pedobacter polaris]TKC09853.1 hypothetical protein FA048_06465 [Pedobacter polaris]